MERHKSHQDSGLTFSQSDFNLHFKYHPRLSFRYINCRYFLMVSTNRFIVLLDAAENAWKFKLHFEAPAFYSFSAPHQLLLPNKHEYSWEWLENIIFQYEIKTVTFAFAFANIFWYWKEKCFLNFIEAPDPEWKPFWEAYKHCDLWNWINSTAKLWAHSCWERSHSEDMS